MPASEALPPVIAYCAVASRSTLSLKTALEHAEIHFNYEMLLQERDQTRAVCYRCGDPVAPQRCGALNNLAIRHQENGAC
jgi:hypothetical protein